MTPQQQSTVVGIDATWLLHRAHHMPGGANKANQVAEWCCEFASKLGPARHACAFFDGPNVFRYKLYPQYKATRRAGNDSTADHHDVTDTSGPYQYMEELLGRLTDMGFPWMQLSEYEADDLQATLAAVAPAGWQVILVAKDKDAKQNLSKRTRVFCPGTGKPGAKGSTVDTMLTERWLRDSTGLSPQQTLDMQTLCGDKVDNVLPIAGFGPAKAKALILEHGSLATFLKNNKKFMTQHGQHVMLNRAMVKLVTDTFEVRSMDRQFGLPTKVNPKVLRPGRHYLEMVQYMSRKTLF